MPLVLCLVCIFLCFCMHKHAYSKYIYTCVYVCVCLCCCKHVTSTLKQASTAATAAGNKFTNISVSLFLNHHNTARIWMYYLFNFFCAYDFMRAFDIIFRLCFCSPKKFIKFHFQLATVIRHLQHLLSPASTCCLLSVHKNQMYAKKCFLHINKHNCLLACAMPQRLPNFT